MQTDLIYPGKEPKMIVKVKCKKCQYLGEAAEFLKINRWKNTCPQCREVKDLVLILNNREEIDLSVNKKLSLRSYLILIISGMLGFIVYKLFIIHIATLIMGVIFFIAAMLITIDRRSNK